MNTIESPTEQGPSKLTASMLGKVGTRFPHSIFRAFLWLGMRLGTYVDSSPPYRMWFYRIARRGRGVFTAIRPLQERRAYHILSAAGANKGLIFL